MLTTISFYELGWFSTHYNRASNWIYKVSEHTHLSRSATSIISEIDEIVAYLLNEKLNEANFISCAKKNLRAIHTITIPPNNSQLYALSHSFNPGVELPSAVERNERKEVKVRKITKDHAESRIADFMHRNDSYLKSLGILVDTEKNEIVIGKHAWTIN